MNDRMSIYGRVPLALLLIVAGCASDGSNGDESSTVAEPSAKANDEPDTLPIVGYSTRGGADRYDGEEHVVDGCRFFSPLADSAVIARVESVSDLQEGGSRCNTASTFRMSYWRVTLEVFNTIYGDAADTLDVVMLSEFTGTLPEPADVILVELITLRGHDLVDSYVFVETDLADLRDAEGAEVDLATNIPDLEADAVRVRQDFEMECDHTGWDVPARSDYEASIFHDGSDPCSDPTDEDPASDGPSTDG